MESYREVGVSVGVLRPLRLEDGEPFSLSNEITLRIRT